MIFAIMFKYVIDKLLDIKNGEGNFTVAKFAETKLRNPSMVSDI
jgi:hypothetical protein